MAMPFDKTSTETILLRDENRDKVIVQGTTKPVDTTKGYAKGCLFIDTDVVSGTSGVYFNKGTNKSCIFELAPVASTGTFTTIEASGNITLGAGADLIGSATSDITVNTDKFTVAGATGNTAVGGTLAVTGATTLTAGIAGKVITAGITASTGPGAVALTGAIHEITTTGTGDALTLDNGTAGQKLTIIYVAEGDGGDTAVLTPTTLAGGSTITFNALGDSCDLTYSETGGWYMTGGTATIA